MTIGVGVIGGGTVGGGVISILTNSREHIKSTSGVDIRLVHVADIDTRKFQGFDLDGIQISEDAEELLRNPSVDVVCELIGGIEPARRFILEAFRQGKHVITANKMLLAHHGPELTQAATSMGVELRYEAAVAGGIPIIKAIREGLAASVIRSVYGIFNGTCNYILTRMTYDGLEFADALSQAIERGFAETPPDLDIEGHDTAHKCSIIASLCSSSVINLKDVYVEGITRVTHADVLYAKEMGYIIKLLGIVRNMDDSVEVRVHPTLVPEDHLLASVRNEFNAVYVLSEATDATLYYGRGAGRMPTAGAVVADIIDIGRRNKSAPMPAFVFNAERRVRPIGEVESRYYLRLTTLDKPGVLGKVCTILGAKNVSIASCIQKEEHEERPVHVVLMTHTTREASLQAALSEIDQLDFIREKTQVLRVL